MDNTIMGVYRVQGLGLSYIGVIIIGVMEKKMDTTIMGVYRVQGLGLSYIGLILG